MSPLSENEPVAAGAKIASRAARSRGSEPGGSLITLTIAGAVAVVERAMAPDGGSLGRRHLEMVISPRKVPALTRYVPSPSAGTEQCATTGAPQAKVQPSRAAASTPSFSP